VALFSRHTNESDIKIFSPNARFTRRNRLLEAAVEAPKATFGGEDLYPKVSDKAAVYFDALINRHPFEDGNKRVAQIRWQVIWTLLGTALPVARIAAVVGEGENQDRIRFERVDDVEWESMERQSSGVRGCGRADSG
jgi:hypothetical protein